MSDIHETPDIGIAASHGGKAPPRDRALTEEGKAYNIETLSKRYTYLTTKIKRQCNHLLELLETNNSDMISAQSSLLDLQYAEAEELNKRLIDLLDNEMVNQQLTSHEVTDTLVFDIKDKVCKWTKQNEASSSQKSRSHRSRSSKGSRSHKTSSKTSSSKSRASVADLKIEAQLLQNVQNSKQRELECRVMLEHAKMDSEKAKLQQKLIKAQLEEGEDPERIDLPNVSNEFLPVKSEYVGLNKPVAGEIVGPHTQIDSLDADKNTAIKSENTTSTSFQPVASSLPLLPNSSLNPKISFANAGVVRPKEYLQQEKTVKNVLPTSKQQLSTSHSMLPSASSLGLVTSKVPQIMSASVQKSMLPSSHFQCPPLNVQESWSLPAKISYSMPAFYPKELPSSQILNDSYSNHQPCSFPYSMQQTPIQEHQPLSLNHQPGLIPQNKRQTILDQQLGSPQDSTYLHQHQGELTRNVFECMNKLADLTTAPNVDMDIYAGDPLQFEYFRATFKEVVERKIPDERGRYTRLLKFTAGEAKELIKHCIFEEEEECYTRAMDLLEKEFGNKQLVINRYLEKLKAWPKVPLNDAKAYKKLHTFLLEGTVYMKGGHLVELDSDTLMRTAILSKMDRIVQEKWLNKVVNNREKNGTRLGFNDLVNFVKRLATCASDPSFSQQAYKDDHKVSNFNNYGINIKFAYCMVCGQTHHIDECQEFKAMTVKERAHYLFHNKLCFHCLKDIGHDHIAQNCKSQVKCRECGQNHNTLLHGHESKIMKVSTIHTGQGNITMCIVPVKVHQANCDKEVLTYALLDENSQGTFIQNSIIDALEVQTRDALIITQTINGSSTFKAQAVEGLTVEPLEDFQNVYGKQSIQLPTTYSRDNLLFHNDEVPTKESLKDYAYLSNIADKLPEFNPSLELGLIIGANCPKALEPQEVIPAEGNGPFASRSKLGWRVIGPVSMIKEVSARPTNCFRIGLKVASIDITNNKPSNLHFSSSEKVSDAIVSNQLQQMYQMDFSEVESEQRSYSKEDHRFISLMESEVKKVDGHYQVPLPFKNKNIKMPNNRQQAFKRLESVGKKMLKDSSYKEDYIAFMQNIMDKGYAVKSKASPIGRTFYLPHFGTYHPTKKKIWVVFDCSINNRGVCLNDELMQGPDLTCMLLGVLLRFRLGKIPYMADIESMFYQVLVPPEHQTFLKFLWWPQGNIKLEPEEYQMRVHLFGATSSPSCANFALRQTVADNLCEGTPEADTIRRNFYVDDMLKSDETSTEAIQNIHRVQQLCQSGGFNLTKFVCPDTDVLNSIPPEKLSKEVSKILNKEDITERALGVQWCLESDKFQLCISLKDSPITKRGILSVISSIYDPLGISGPFILLGKKILEKISALRDGWDSPVPIHLAKE